MKESQHIEWKESWRDDYLRWICGFANADGGTLVIGRNDDGIAIGVSNARKLLADLPNKIRDVLGIMADIHLITESECELIEIHVNAYPNPISYKGEYHYRSGSTKQELKGAALNNFLLRRQAQHWDGVPVQGVSINDLDAKALAGFRQRAARSGRLPTDILEADDASLIDKLHLLDGQHLKRAAVLLFHSDPQRFITGAFVKIGFFHNDADLVYHDEISGGIFQQVSETLERLFAKYLKTALSYEGVQRIETWPIPEPALREAVLNAIAHKDYASGAPIQISVYADKLLIWNPGQLPPDWTVERLASKHASIPFNPDVANVFFRAGIIESWGRGIERMFNECAMAGVPAPQLRHESTGLWVEFSLVRPLTMEVAMEVTMEVTMEVKLLRALTEPLSRQALQTTLGLKNNDHFRKTHLLPALESGLIEMTIPDKPTSRLQKYRITAAGEAKRQASGVI